MVEGTNILHYEILEKIGEGGMGVVYKATDSKLNRTVALKFLPAHLTKSKSDQQRFIREAQAAAALNHSNICTIYNVEEHDDQHFISMEYIDGVTLREKLQSGDLTPATALEYGIRIANALSEAHENGIVHRDIKPGNIMVDSKNRIKVMDFGLAKLVGSVPITQTGTTVGTMAYMAPEQIQGRPVDHRADLFSFGVLLFEMLTGQRPFTGKYDAALSYSIVHEDPPPLSELLPNAPEKLSMLVSRLLEKDPAKRYSVSEQLAIELKSCLNELPKPVATSKVIQTSTKDPIGSEGSGSTNITLNLPSLRSPTGLGVLAGLLILVVLTGYWLLPAAGSIESVDNTLAVLPLESISTDPEDIQFTDGVHEELINRLAGIGDLSVISRRSVLDFSPNDREDLQAIGEQLGVSALIDGSVRFSGDQIRVYVELIDVETQRSLWSGTFEENIDDVFEIQSRIARQVAGELHASMTQEEVQQLTQRPTDNPEAYRLYMLGRQYLSRPLNLPENRRAAQQYFTRSLDLDPEFAQAWGMLAVTYHWIYKWQGRKSEDLQKMKDAAEWALFYGPNLAETYLANGVTLYWDKSNQEQTLAHFEMALQQYPNNSLLHLMTAYTHRSLGNWKKQIEHLEKALDQDPLNTILYMELNYSYSLLRDYQNVEMYIDRLMDVNATVAGWVKASSGVSRYGTLDGWESLWDHTHPLDPAEVYPYQWGHYNSLKRDWEEALRGFRNLKNDVFAEGEWFYMTKQYLIAKTLDAQGNRTQALNLYEQIRDELETFRDNNPDMARYRMELGKVYSRMGEHEKAIQEAEIASDLLDPLRQDAELHPIIESELAEIYAWSGQEDLAIDKLEFAISVPSTVNRNNLRMNPIWDPLLDNPRFQELIAGEDEPYLEGL